MANPGTLKKKELKMITDNGAHRLVYDRER